MPLAVVLIPGSFFDPVRICECSILNTRVQGEGAITSQNRDRL